VGVAELENPREGQCQREVGELSIACVVGGSALWG
jgi:hypothetical protein